MDSFANKLLNVQRQAETLLNRFAGVADPAIVQQSFLLRAGHFVGVRWEQGDWRAEWTFPVNELILSSAGEERQRVALQLPNASQITNAGQAIETGERRAA